MVSHLPLGVRSTGLPPLGHAGVCCGYVRSVTLNTLRFAPFPPTRWVGA
jgi:hypothetical protein